MITDGQKRALFTIAYRKLYNQIRRPRKGSKAKVLIVFTYPQDRCFQALVSGGLATCHWKYIEGKELSAPSRVWVLTSEGKKVARQYAKKLIAEQRAKLRPLTE